MRAERAPEGRPFGVRGWRPEWSAAELSLLERLCRENCSMEEICERMPDRSRDGIKHQMSRMNIHARHVYSGGKATHDGRGVLARARALRERKMEAERERRVA
jgi:hypothetical protein